MKYWLFTLFSALLIVLSFAPWGYWPLIFVALVPWFIVLERRPELKFSWFLGFSMSVLGFPWVATSVQSHGELPWLISIPIWLVFCCFNQMQFLLFGCCYRFLREKKTLTLALLYTLVDHFFPKLFQDTLGHALIGSKFLAQNAAFFGVAPLTSWVLAVNHALLKPKKNGYFILASFAFFFSTGICSVYNIQPFLGDAPSIPATVIQANISNINKAAARRGYMAAMEEAFSRYETMTRERMFDGSAFYVWPESAFPDLYQPTGLSPLHQKLALLLKDMKKPLLFGAVSYSDGRLQNGLHLHDTKGHAWSYFKSILLPFAEFVPFSDLFPFILARFPQIGNFKPGQGPEIQSIKLETGTFRIHPNICYEILIPAFLREAREMQPDFVVNITNDGWFGQLGEAELHLDLARFRAIETRLPILRATNTGITTLIDPLGQLVQPSSTFKEETPQFNIPLLKIPPTFVQLWGHKCWIWLYLLILISVKGLAILRSRTDP